MRNRVKLVRTHNPVFAEGYGQQGTSFPSKTIPGIVMLRASDGVEVSAPGRVSFLIASSMIASMDFYEEVVLGSTPLKEPKESSAV